MPQIVYFAYIGPNRRSDMRLVEARVDFTAEQAAEEGFEGFAGHVRGLLTAGGVLDAGEAFPPEPFPDPHMGGFASLLAQTALLFQRKAGHRVNYQRLIPEPQRRRYTVLVEHEHCDVGMSAMKLAVELLNGQRKHLAEPFREFCEFARARLLPLETEAIIAAARKQRVPCYQLERYPLSVKPWGPDRIRSNGLLRLGDGARGRSLDGTLRHKEASEPVKAWLEDAGARRELLRSLGAPPAAAAPAGGRRFHLVVVGGRVFAAEDLGGGRVRAAANVDETLSGLALRVYRETGNQPVSLLLSGAGAGRPLGGGEVEVLDFELAPDLGALFSEASGHLPGMLDEVADCLVRDLFPSAEQARIPTVAVTGTNGKTTTSRMLGHILQQAGLKPGLVCTNGVYVDGEMLRDTDTSAATGHIRLLTRDDIESAVLETHHRGIFLRGFAFYDCDVAVCLNVTEDHLDRGGIESLEELVELKFALIARARRAAILYADNPGSCGMRERVTADRLWLVSLESDVAGLRALAGERAAGFAVVERIDGEEWLVLYDRGQRIPLLASRQIPATLDGAARFNVSNALHAAPAALELGVPVETVRAALGTFRAGWEQTPGRLNVYDRLPFRVVIDNAHNPDGLRQLMKFVDRQSTAGRKVISFSAPPSRHESIYRQMGRAVAGHFDLYFCVDATPKEKAGPAHLAPILHRELVAGGAGEQAVLLAKRGREAWKEIFAACAPGDLLMLVLPQAEFEDARRFIESYADPAP